MTLLTLALALTGTAAAGELTIPHEKYELDNGLEVILAPDRSTPIAFVQVWYKVGSKDEQPGLTGFAHLFEHLMFQGSENAPGEYFTPLQEIGGNVNGSTNLDRTEYHEQVPSQHLPLALFMESDRMGWFLGTLDQGKLDNQREVVRNERRQNYENPPYGDLYPIMLENTWPDGHPYHHTTIGSHEDLEAATLDTVKEFFRTWYVPNYASLVVSGDFDVDATKALIEQYFGPIPRGPDPKGVTAPLPTIDETREVRVYSDVPEQKFWVTWIAPALYAPGDAELDLLSSVLSDGKDSRLYTALVQEQRIAKDISAAQWSSGLGSMYVLSGTASKGHTTDEVLAAADKVIAEVLGDKPPTAEELEGARNDYEAAFWGRLESVSGKGSTLSSYNAMAGTPDYLKQDLGRYTAATPEAVVEWGRKITSQPRVEIHYWPEADRPASTDSEETE